MNKDNLNYFLDLWEKEKYRHFKIKEIASLLINFDNDEITAIIFNRVLKKPEVFLDFAGTFFWEFWKYKTPNKEVLDFFIFNVNNIKNNEIIKYSISLALVSCYKNHKIYNKIIYKKLKSIIENESCNFNENCIDLIYEAIY